MLRAIVRSSLLRPGTALALGCGLLVWGVWTATHASLDVFPEFVPPQVVVQTEAPGLAPEQVEALVTLPVESALGGLGELASLRSESIQGLSVVTATFEESADVFHTRQLLTERLAELAGRLPQGVQPPRMSALTSSTMDVLKIGLLSDTRSPMDLRALADWTVRPRLLAIPGVARVNVFGGEVRQLQVQVQPERLRARGLALSDVLTAARAATAIRGAGFIETDGQRILLQSEGQTLGAADLGRVAVAGQGAATVRLADVARVVEGPAPAFGDTRIQGRPGVLLTMSSGYGTNTLEVTERLEAALAEMQPLFEREGVTVLPRLHRPASFIESALRNLRSSLLIGGALVAGILLLFLGRARTALISLTAIPLSLLGAVVVLERLGLTLNTMTLGGLAIAIGEVVDDAIIDVENIVRRLRENRTLPTPRSVFAVVLDASLEIRKAVVFATLTVAAVFIPLLGLSGVQGRFFAPLALAYLLAIGTSLCVALTITPALALVAFRRNLGRLEEPTIQTRLKRAYRHRLERVLHRPRAVVAAAALLCVGGASALPLLGGEFLPAFREGHLVLQLNTAPGTSLKEMLHLGEAVTARLLAIPGVSTVEQQVGRAEQGEDTWGPHRSEFHVELAPKSARDEERIVDRVREVLEQVPGSQSEVLTFLGDRIGESLTGETAQVVIDLFGEDLDLLDAKAREVARVVGGVPGAADVQQKAPPGAPYVSIRLLPERLARFGFRPEEVLAAVETAYQGTVVAQVRRGRQVVDLVVVLDEAERDEPEGIRALPIRSGGGVLLTLGDLAEVFPTSGRATIRHDGGRRRQTVTCNARGRDVASVVADARRAIAAQVDLPRGVYVAFSGAADARAEAQAEILGRSGLAAAAIVLLLGTALGNARNLLLVLVNVPFALVGGAGAALLGQRLLPGEAGLSLGSLVGFVTLFGITMRNSIMLVSHFEHLVVEEGAVWGRETAIRGASERIVPILMTALVTGLGLLPLALGSGAAGREIEGPMAVVILGGLVTSTALNLLVLPTLALRWGRFEATEREQSPVNPSAIGG